MSLNMALKGLMQRWQRRFCPWARICGLEVDNADTEELVEHYEEQKLLEGLNELQSEQQKSIVHEHSTQEEKGMEEVSSDVINPFIEKQGEDDNFFEKHHPNVIVRQSVESNKQYHGLSFPEGCAVEEKTTSQKDFLSILTLQLKDKEKKQ